MMMMMKTTVRSVPDGSDNDDDKDFDNDDGDVEAGGKYISWNDGERETENEDLVFEAMNVQIQLQIQI